MMQASSARLLHPAQRLWDSHHVVAPYPAGVVPVPEPIAGTAFFPGGFGLWRPEQGSELPPFPHGGLMVLGHDFHSEAGYAQSRARGAEAMTQPTWRSLLRLMERAGLEPAECFFTNTYMGLRAGEKTTGVFPGGSAADFVDRCLCFLAEQIAVQRPRAILTLGRFVPPLLARLSPDLVQWRPATTLLAIDEAGPLKHNVSFDTVGGFSCAVAALTHPSLRHLAIARRRFERLEGDAAEVSMIVKARSA